jgi:hypothetical protein
MLWEVKQDVDPGLTMQRTQSRLTIAEANQTEAKTGE